MFSKLRHYRAGKVTTHWTTEQEANGVCLDVPEKKGSSRLQAIKPRSFDPQPDKITSCHSSISSVNLLDNMQNVH